MARRIAERMTVVLVTSLTTFLAGCASGSIGDAVPVAQYKEPPSSTSTTEYVINSGDMLSIQVWEQGALSNRMRVRSDGKITLPLIGDVQAAGKTPLKLAADLEGSLKAIVLNPKVTIVVEDSKAPTISMMGEVGKPGSLPVDSEMGVAQAIAASGGLTAFAHKDRIFVVRSTGAEKPVRIHFTYDELTKTVGPASQFKLRPGDVVIVE
jgi:polysaccharide biosynthesis/export protein